jgi:ectoine hydroxylase-related dioxygenase (phytanoyl-CoA dioxygenase family)
VIRDAAVEAFRADGHVVIRDIASRALIDSCRPILESVVHRVSAAADRQGRIDDYSKLFTQVTNVWRIDEAAREIVFNRRFAETAARLLGVPSVRLYHDQALFKPAGAARTPWHQDRYYWPLDTELTATMWLPLVDIDEEMGPMIFATGSHRARNLGDLVISDTTDQRLASMIADRRWRTSSTLLRAGDASFHFGATIHSAGANRSSRTREVLTVIYFAAGTRATTPANDNQRADLEVFLPGVRSGDEAASPLNPVLYP